MKLPEKWKLKLRLSTVIAVAAGLGAAGGYSLIPWYWMLIVPAIMPLLKKRQIICGIIAFIIALGSGIIQLYLNQKARSSLPSRPSLIHGEIRCIDRQLSRRPELPAKKVVSCEVISDGKTFETAAIFPDNRQVFYGDTFTFSGIYNPPQSAGLRCENGDIAEEYPPLYGDRPLLIVKETSPKMPSFSLLRGIFVCRDFLLKYLLSDIKSPTAAAMAAKLFFGTSNGLPRDLNEDFINTGTIHLFSVSGLHVGLATMFIMLLLGFLPFGIRHRVAAFFILFYVLCSGASLPAVRAGCMMIIWCILTSFLCPAPTWNSLMFTWSAFAIIAPETVASISAQYSFGITAALLLLSERINEHFARHRNILNISLRKNRSMKREHQIIRRQKSLCSTLFAPMTAFAAGCGISIFRQNNFATGSVATNLMIIFITPLLFGAMFFKLILGSFIPFCNRIGAFVLEGAFQLLIEITDNMSQFFSPLNVSSPPLWSVIIFYLLLFTALGFKANIFSGLSLTGAVMIIFMWQHPAFQPEPFVMVISSDSSRPPLMAFVNPQSGMTSIVDIPDAQTGALAGKILRSKGITHSNVYLSSGTDRSSRGLKNLSKKVDLTIYQHFGENEATKAFNRNLTNAQTPQLQLPPPDSMAVPTRDSAEFQDFHGCRISSQNTDSGRLITVKKSNGTLIQETLPWCSRPVVWIKELK